MIGRLKFDLEKLVNEILDHLPQQVWTSKSTRFLDPAMGGGQFVAEIERRLLSAGHSKKNVASRVFGCETNVLRVNYATNRLGLVGNYRVSDSFDKDWRGMKFDVIVGNPPFQQGLWKTFIAQACELSTRHVCMIGPDTITQYSASRQSENFKTLLVKNGIQSVQDATSHFPHIRSGAISVFMMDLTKKAQETVFVKTGIQHQITDKVLSYTPNGTLHAILASQNSNYTARDRSDSAIEGYVKVIDSVSADGTVKLAWLKDYTNKCVQGKDYWFSNRFFGQSKNFAVVKFDGQVTLGQNITAIQKIPGMSLKTFREIYGSKLFRFVLSVVKNGKFDTPVAAINKLPIVTHTDLYAHFNLTTEEIAYIESHV